MSCVQSKPLEYFWVLLFSNKLSSTLTQGSLIIGFFTFRNFSDKRKHRNPHRESPSSQCSLRFVHHLYVVYPAIRSLVQIQILSYCYTFETAFCLYSVSNETNVSPFPIIQIGRWVINQNPLIDCQYYLRHVEGTGRPPLFRVSKHSCF